MGGMAAQAAPLEHRSRGPGVTLNMRVIHPVMITQRRAQRRVKTSVKSLVTMRAVWTTHYDLGQAWALATGHRKLLTKGAKMKIPKRHLFSV